VVKWPIFFNTTKPKAQRKKKYKKKKFLVGLVFSLPIFRFTSKLAALAFPMGMIFFSLKKSKFEAIKK
jgi:hypothetical protein